MWRGLAPNVIDRRYIERAEVSRRDRIEPATTEHSLGAAFLQGGVIEKRIGSGIEDLLRKRGRLGEIARMRAPAIRLEIDQQLLQAFDVHGFVQAVLDRLLR